MTGPVQLSRRCRTYFGERSARFEFNFLYSTDGITHRKSIAKTRRKQLIPNPDVSGRVNMQQIKLLFQTCTLGNQSEVTSEHLYRY